MKTLPVGLVVLIVLAALCAALGAVYAYIYFPVTAARAWNALPSSVRSAQSLLPFRRDLKTTLRVSVIVLFTIVFGCVTDCNC